MSCINYFSRLAVTDLLEENIRLKCLEHYSEDKHNLSLENFDALVRDLFVDGRGNSYATSSDQLQIMFDAFDSDKDGVIDDQEFQVLWTDFLCPILHPISALIVVDVQNDFIDGSLAIRNCPAKQEGLEIVQVINTFIHNFDNVVYTYDWHPEDHISFIDNIGRYEIDNSSEIKNDNAKVFDTVTFSGQLKFEQKLWPRHCVQNTWGSELHSGLEIAKDAVFIYKGTKSDNDSYSAFWDNQKKSQTDLNEKLKARNVTDVYICGLAYDYCVGSTALHALELGYRTLIIENACRGVNNEDIKSMKDELLSKQACVVNSESIPALVAGHDRKVELGVAIAINKRNLDNKLGVHGHVSATQHSVL